jgi:hypothetical protein
MSILRITRVASAFLQQHPNIIHAHARFMASSSTLHSPSEHRVILDNKTLYVDKSLAEALGWKSEHGSDAGIELSLSGWGPTYFVIAPAGSESGESQCINVAMFLILLLLRSSCSRGSREQSQSESRANFRLFEGALTCNNIIIYQVNVQVMNAPFDLSIISFSILSPSPSSGLLLRQPSSASTGLALGLMETYTGHYAISRAIDT